MPKRQNLKNKGHYVGNLTGKISKQRLQDNRTRASNNATEKEEMHEL